MYYVLHPKSAINTTRNIAPDSAGILVSVLQVAQKLKCQDVVPIPRMPDIRDSGVRRFWYAGHYPVDI